MGMFGQFRLKFEEKFRSQGSGGGGQVRAELRASLFVFVVWFDQGPAASG